MTTRSSDSPGSGGRGPDHKLPTGAAAMMKTGRGGRRDDAGPANG